MAGKKWRNSCSLVILEKTKFLTRTLSECFKIGLVLKLLTYLSYLIIITLKNHRENFFPLSSSSRPGWLFVLGALVCERSEQRRGWASEASGEGGRRQASHSRRRRRFASKLIKLRPLLFANPRSLEEFWFSFFFLQRAKVDWPQTASEATQYSLRLPCGFEGNNKKNV